LALFSKKQKKITGAWSGFLDFGRIRDEVSSLSPSGEGRGEANTIFFLTIFDYSLQSFGFSVRLILSSFSAGFFPLQERVRFHNPLALARDRLLRSR
jgi:hypothetical protein